MYYKLSLVLVFLFKKKEQIYSVLSIFACKATGPAAKDDSVQHIQLDNINILSNIMESIAFRY